MSLATAAKQSYLVEVRTIKPKSRSAASFHATWEVAQLYFLRGELTPDDLSKLATQLLSDPVTETFSTDFSTPTHTPNFVDVTLLPGVTDPVAENLLQAASWIGISTLEQVATGHRYYVQEALTSEQLSELATEVFSNPVIQRYSVNEPIEPPFVPYQERDATVDYIPLRDANDKRLMEISSERRLSLSLEEMQAIRAYFQSEKREPSDVELEMLAQTWSEHCVHKTFRAKIDYRDENGQQTIDGLLKTYLRSATDKLAKPWVRSAFVDNAGIIAFTEHWDLALKAETHNHPSALEPFGGANTGVGGVVRDILGVSARPIANTDVLCFGWPDTPAESLPDGVLHPHRIAEGVTKGVEDYGNKMGIPTVNGAIVYHSGYTSNPLVFCGCLGLLPHGSHVTKPEAGDLIVVIGGRTGRDGLRGATFSSMEMDTSTSEIAGSSVQIGHPIHEKQVQEVILKARDAKLYNAITDCGAGGLSSAVGEMAKDIGARVQLETVPLKYPGLRPWEIWLSEAQERMVLAVPPSKWADFKKICDGQDVEAVSIGTLEANGRLLLYFESTLVAQLSMDFLHDGIPQMQLKAEWKTPQNKKSQAEPQFSLDESLLKLLAHPDIRSKEEVIRRYDHEVQGATALKPLVGVDNQGPADASVLVPMDTREDDAARGVALSNGIAPLYGETDPYAMAWASIDEAMRNLVTVGVDPTTVSILDNFCWGNPRLPDRLGSLVRCVQGCYDAALAYGTPFISGKDSLNNEYMGADGQRHAIPGTLMITGMGIVPDVKHTVSSDFKRAGSVVYLVGETRDEQGGSHYHLVNKLNGGQVPQPKANALATMQVIYGAIQSDLILSCHDCSEGGLAVTLAEMCIGGRLGITANVMAAASDAATALYAESLTRFVVEVAPEHQAAFEAALSGQTLVKLGVVTQESQFKITHGSTVVDFKVADLEQAWRGEVVEAERPSQLPAKSECKTVIHNRTVHSGKPCVMIIHANGSNRDRDAALACTLAGTEPEVVHMNQILSGEKRMRDYHMLIVPGGFSYGDDLGAGKLWALNLRHRLNEDIQAFVKDGRPVMGICNGFQTLVKAGVLPGVEGVTLTYNVSSQFECRWVKLQPQVQSPCLFTEGLDEPIYCPVAHGEGRVVAHDPVGLWNDGLVALTYANATGEPTAYPENPNGSDLAIAGLTNAAGNVLGLMPHPENHIFPWQHPNWRRGETGMSGLRLFENAVKYA
jgi:phosphoribosylformylglycinamidine synthase